MNVTSKLFRALTTLAIWLIGGGLGGAAEKFAGRCDVEFTGESSLHTFTGHVTNVPLTVYFATNSLGATTLNTRIELSPRQLTTHHAKRDANMYKMFRGDEFPKLMVVVTNASLADARLFPSNSPDTNGKLPLQLTICGTTKHIPATTSHPQFLAGILEFELDTEISLKDFNLKPPGALLGTVTVRDRVKVNTHVKLQKEPP